MKTKDKTWEDIYAELPNLVFKFFGNLTLDRKKLPGSSNMAAQKIALSLNLKPDKIHVQAITKYMYRANLDEYKKPHHTSNTSNIKWRMPPLV